MPAIDRDTRPGQGSLPDQSLAPGLLLFFTKSNKIIGGDIVKAAELDKILNFQLGASVLNMAV